MSLSPPSSSIPTPTPTLTMPPPSEIFVPVGEQKLMLAKSYVGITVTALVIALIPFAARIYVRLRPVWRFGWDDYLIGAGLACAIIDWGIFYPNVLLTQEHMSLSDIRITAMRSHLGVPVWSLAMTLIKTSVAVTLLRLPLQATSRAVLYTMMVIQIAYCIAALSYQLFRCRPIQAAWDISIIDEKCPSIQVTLAVSTLGSAINITTDIVLSVAPTVIFWNLRRPLRERIVICTLSCLGLLASAASVMKAVVIGTWQGEKDMVSVGLRIATWTVLEQLVSVTAACGPALKRPIEFVLAKFGIVLIPPESTISFVHMGLPDRRERMRRRESIELLEEDEEAAQAVHHQGASSPSSLRLTPSPAVGDEPSSIAGSTARLTPNVEQTHLKHKDMS
ncbi:hypothetical protein QBC43DRAFT_288880 [Cladorrhinum sp. PSN259]|nr:hypothetical protein QBC43DRAFT_288880 [Cladorrhinum sp. PSN259]